MLNRAAATWARWSSFPDSFGAPRLRCYLSCSHVIRLYLRFFSSPSGGIARGGRVAAYQPEEVPKRPRRSTNDMSIC